MSASLHEAAQSITHEVVTFTPLKAAQWLEEHAHDPNRRVSEAKVLEYRSDMVNRRWHFEGAPLRLSKSNKLQDGRHRLTALAGITDPTVEIPFLVVRGLGETAQLYMDQGQPRSVAQQLGLQGVSNGHLYSAIARLYINWTRGRLFTGNGGGGTSKPEVTQWVLDHQELLHDAVTSGISQVDAPPSVVGAFALAVLQVNPEKGREFLAKLAAGAGLEEGDPILALDRRLRNIRRTGVMISQREYLGYFIRAWNAWLVGDTLAKMVQRELTEATFPELLTVSESETVG